MRSTAMLVLVAAALAQPVLGQGSPPTSAPTPPVDAPPVVVPRQLTLEQADALLVQYNTTVQGARYGVDVARGTVASANVRPNPTLTLGAEAFNLRAPGKNLFSTGNTASQRVYTVRLDEVFERGHKRQLRTATALSQLQAADAQVLDALRLQRLQLRQAFFTAVLARENVRTAEENLRLTEDTERLIKVRVEAGEAPAWDLIKFQTNKIQFRRDLEAAKLAYRQAASDVLTALGASAEALSGPAAVGGTAPLPTSLTDTPLEVVGDLYAVPAPPPLSLTDMRQAALAHRPDVVAAQRLVEAGQHNVEVARAQRHSDPDVALEYQRNGSDNTVGATVSLPLLVFNRYQGQIAQALGQLHQAEASLRQVQVAAQADVDKVYQAYQQNQRLLTLYTTESLAKSFRVRNSA